MDLTTDLITSSETICNISSAHTQIRRLGKAGC